MAGRLKSSHSRLSGYGFCPKKYEYRYVLETPAPPRAELAFGVALHAALEENFKQKTESRKDLPVEALAAVFLERLRAGLAGVPEDSLRGAADPHYLEAMGQHFLSRFLSERAPALQPAPRGVECRFLIPLPGGHEISGAFDLLDSDWVLHDFKTSSKPYDPRRADRTQLVIYAWACERMFGRPPKALCFDVFVKGDGAGGAADGAAGLQAPVFFPTPAPDEMAQVARRLSALLDRINAARAKDDFPRSFEPGRCHWCEYQDPCRAEWEAEGRPAPVRVSLGSLA